MSILTEQNKEVDFPGMTKIQKECFLSNDLIERLIRVEQRVSTHFGYPLPYNKTEYYKNLTLKEKKRFNRYLKSKRIKKIGIGLLIFLPLIFLAVSRISFTGNFVKNSFEFHPGLNYFVLFFFCLFIFLAFYFSISKRKKHKRFDHHFRIVDNLLHKKIFK